MSLEEYIPILGGVFESQKSKLLEQFETVTDEDVVEVFMAVSLAILITIRDSFQER